MNLKLKIILFIFLCLAGIISHYLWGDNNIVEQISEDVIKEKYGIDIDFSEDK